MNIAKNMEAIFVAAIVVASATTFATAAVNEPAAAIAPVIAVKADATVMPTVTVTAKRLTAAEKAAL
jgi:uncharacterized membrane protein YhaH (DUF805 family)